MKLPPELEDGYVNEVLYNYSLETFLMNNGSRSKDLRIMKYPITEGLGA